MKLPKEFHSLEETDALNVLVSTDSGQSQLAPFASTDITSSIGDQHPHMRFGLEEDPVVLKNISWVSEEGRAQGRARSQLSLCRGWGPEHR